MPDQRIAKKRGDEQGNKKEGNGLIPQNLVLDGKESESYDGDEEKEAENDRELIVEALALDRQARQ
jgi:hypothetical protein